MHAKPLMFLGTGSDVGKSILAAAFCRILKQDGYSVAPFKAQNMALNSFITPEGGEMGRAQVVQAEAAGIEPNVDMNPILLKPTSQMGSQVIVQGRAIGNFSAREYYEHKKNLVSTVRSCFERLSSQYDVIVMEGAGSAVELNLKEHDIVNLAMAEMADARCVLVGDIDRGGIFAALLGGLMLMLPHEQERVIGFMVNKMRGDPSLFTSGVEILQSRSGKPVFGVIPHFTHITIQEEDSLALSRRMDRRLEPVTNGSLPIGVVRLPFISNYTDFDCLEHDPAVRLVYFDNPSEVFQFDAVLLPGSKNTLDDLQHLRKTGMADAIAAYYRSGGTVVGICGGFQMLGDRVKDPLGVESGLLEVAGLGLLPMETEMAESKVTSQVKALYSSAREKEGALVLCGYEIHMGQSRATGAVEPLFRITVRDGGPVDAFDGFITPDGRVWGTYVHGVFDNDRFRMSFLNTLRLRSGREAVSVSSRFSYSQWKDEQYDLLADHVRRHSDVKSIYRAIGIV